MMSLWKAKNLPKTFLCTPLINNFTHINFEWEIKYAERQMDSYTFLVMHSFHPLVSNNSHTVLQSVAFNSLMTQHLCQPIMAIRIHPCWSPPFFFLFFHEDDAGGLEFARKKSNPVTSIQCFACCTKNLITAPKDWYALCIKHIKKH